MMNGQMRMQFPEQPPMSPVPAEEQAMKAAQEKYGILNKPLMQQDGVWYTHDFDGTLIKAEDWKAKMDALYEPKDDTRKDIN